MNIDRIRQCFRFLFAFSLFASVSLIPRASYAIPVKTEVTVYAEEGQWFAHAFTVDSEGWPDTIEKSAYPSEGEAHERAHELGRSMGAREIDPVASRTSLRELRTRTAGELWTAENTWDSSWEQRFSEWMIANVDQKFYKRYNIKTDCADVAVSLRWIFARVMKLPAGNRLIGDTALLTNRSVRKIWKNLPTAAEWQNDQRFRAALEYVMQNTYTHSLHADGYPIAIDPKYLSEGAFHLEMRDIDGHTRVVTKIIHKGSGYPVRDMWSNVPRIVRKLYEEPFTVSAQPAMLWGGFMRHRWVRLGTNNATFVAAKDMPGYSIEQYQPDFFHHGIDDFSAEVASRMQQFFDPVQALKAINENIRDGLDDRKKIVEQGVEVCAKEDCSPGTENYENWSTPSRDHRMLGYFQQIQNYLRTLKGDDLARFQKKYDKLRKKRVIKIEGTRFHFYEIEAIWLSGKFSSDPRESPKVRWGI